MDLLSKIVVCIIFAFIKIMVDQLVLAVFTTNSEPRQRIDATGLGMKFEGNTSVPDHFKLLERDGDFLLIGARDIVYNVSVNTFNFHPAVVWPSTEEDVQLCLMKGKSKSDCHNYVRILAKQNQNDLLICGTNSYKPQCRQYELQDGAYVNSKEFSASGICPYDPAHNSTAFYLNEHNELYAGTVADFAGADPLVSKRQINEPDDLGLRTERSDTKCLNDPNFVSSFADADHVYFWFHEGAVEHTNCGKAVHSRVSRVCKNDKGGPRANADTWTTFLKASLNCSIPGDYPFYFDQIEATSGVVLSKLAGSGDENVELVYAVFSTPYNSIRASAVCAFSMDSIRKIFAHSAYKVQASPNSNWLPIFRSQVPQPRPGDCDSDSRLLSEEAVNFVKKNPLMEDQVPNVFNTPLLIESGFKQGVGLTQIVVDAQVTALSPSSSSKTAEIQKYDVIFVGTDDGHVIKLVNIIDAYKSRPVQIEKIKVFDHAWPVINMLIYRPDNNATSNQDASLIVVGDELVKSIPLHYCNQATNCSQCIRLQDPYCAWETTLGKCVGISNGDWSKGTYVQNVKEGDSTGYCSGERSEKKTVENNVKFDDGSPTVTKNTKSNENTAPLSTDHMNNNRSAADKINAVKEQSAYTDSTARQYSAASFFSVIVVAVVGAFFCGLIIGLWLIPKCKKRKTNGRKKFTTDKPIMPSTKPQKVHPNGLLPNGHLSTSNGSTSPLNGDKLSAPDVSIKMDTDDYDSFNKGHSYHSSTRNSPVKQQQYSSHTLPKARQTYL